MEVRRTWLVAAALAMTTLAGCGIVVPAPLPARTEAVACDPPAPAGASPAAQQYAAAAHTALIARMELSATIEAQNNMMSLDDMRTEADIDHAFVMSVAAIPFPDDVAGYVTDFVRAVKDDDAFLLRAAAEQGYYDGHRDERETLLVERGRAGAALREALGLPQSGCMLSLP